MKKLLLTCLAGMVLTSCGGGADGNPSQLPPNSQASTPNLPGTGQTVDMLLVGVWAGTGSLKYTTTNPQNFGPLVLSLLEDSGQLWLVHGDPETVPVGFNPVTSWRGFRSINGMVLGHTRSEGTKLTSEDLLHYTPSGQNHKFLLNGTYTTTKLTATLQASDSQTSIVSLTPSDAHLLQSGVAIQAKDLLGNWNAKEFMFTTVDDPITSQLTISHESDQRSRLDVRYRDCSLTGDLIARGSPLNRESLFSVRLQSGSLCAFRSNKEFRGIAWLQRTSTGRTQFIILSSSEDKSMGLVMFATRP